MTDIELVIKIPEEMYAEIMDENGINTMLIPFSDIIRDGTLLPKGHGRLKDVDKIIRDGRSRGFCDWYDEMKYADTIIEADIESEAQDADSY